MTEGQKQAERLRIGCRIAELRAFDGLSIMQLAAKAHITPANLSNIEHGRYSVGFDTLQRIAAALDCNVLID